LVLVLVLESGGFVELLVSMALLVLLGSFLRGSFLHLVAAFPRRAFLGLRGSRAGIHGDLCEGVPNRLRPANAKTNKQGDSDSGSQSQSHRDDDGLAAAVGKHRSYEDIGLVWCLCFMRPLRLGGHGHCRASVRCCGRGELLVLTSGCLAVDS
jgi:hypothetical protein